MEGSDELPIKNCSSSFGSGSDISISHEDLVDALLSLEEFSDESESYEIEVIGSGYFTDNKGSNKNLLILKENNLSLSFSSDFNKKKSLIEKLSTFYKTQEKNWEKVTKQSYKSLISSINDSKNESSLFNALEHSINLLEIFKNDNKGDKSLYDKLKRLIKEFRGSSSSDFSDMSIESTESNESRMDISPPGSQMSFPFVSSFFSEPRKELTKKEKQEVKDFQIIGNYSSETFQKLPPEPPKRNSPPKGELLKINSSLKKPSDLENAYQDDFLRAAEFFYLKNKKLVTKNSYDKNETYEMVSKKEYLRMQRS